MPEVAVLNVLLHDHRIGTLTRLPDDKVLFAFDPTYADDLERPTLSLSFKDQFSGLITDIKPTQTRLPPFFSNLLPEGAMREYLAVRARVYPQREFFLMWVLGRDLPGALKIVPADRDSLPPNDNDEQAPHRDRGDSDGALRFSLAGVQLKFSAVQQARGGLTIPADGVGGSWIVKLPSTVFEGVPENEFAMMELARRVGIQVPETALVPLSKIGGLPEGIATAGRNVFAIRRFDRLGNGESIHMEDFAQAFGIYPERKYERANYRNIARVLWIEVGETAIAEFVRRLVFTVLIGNGDMHLKNWSLLYPDGRQAQLSPAYDFVSTVGYIKNEELALNFIDSKAFASVTLDAFERFAAKAGLPEKLVLDTARDTVDRFRAAYRETKDIPAQVHGALGAHLKTLPLLDA